MAVKIIHKTITMNDALSNRLIEVSDRVGFSQSYLITRALAEYLFKYNAMGCDNSDQWLEQLGVEEPELPEL